MRASTRRPAMNETAARLRAQKAYSTDPEYLERMALHEEAHDVGTAPEQVERTQSRMRTAE